jgi:hypothetical protein
MEVRISGKMKHSTDRNVGRFLRNRRLATPTAEVGCKQKLAHLAMLATLDNWGRGPRSLGLRTLSRQPHKH